MWANYAALIATVPSAGDGQMKRPRPLGVKRHADAVMPQDLDQVTALTTENLEVSGMRIVTQHLLDLDRQAVHAPPHVGVPDSQPHPHPRGDWDHHRDSAFMTAVANSAGIEDGIRTRALPANLTSIEDSAPAA